MDTNWKDPKIILGNVAKGDFYFHRTAIVDAIWKELEKGNFVLIAAPRRVGKTSVMQYMEEYPKDNYKMIFNNIQGIDSADELYERFFGLTLSCLSKHKSTLIWLKEYLKSRNITEIDILNGKVKMEKINLDYKNELNTLIEYLDNHQKTKIILLIDELPEVLFKLHKAGKVNDAASILNNLRQWRQNSTNKNIIFVFAGSIGVHYVVNIIENRTSVLNDLAEINCFPLERSEIYEYIKWATNEATVQYEKEQIDYMADKIQYFVPYFLNLMLDEINQIAHKNNNPVINENIIDTAFQKISINNSYFSDWNMRLKDYMSKSDYDFVNELLIHLAHKDELTVQIIHDKALKHEKTDTYMEHIDNLIKDGYITKVAEKYIFVSPFLKTYWKHINPVYNG